MQSFFEVSFKISWNMSLTSFLKSFMKTAPIDKYVEDNYLKIAKGGHYSPNTNFYFSHFYG